MEEQEILERIVGKTVKSVDLRNVDTDRIVSIKFTDGSSISIRSWDYEGFSSGLTIRTLSTKEK